MKVCSSKVLLIIITVILTGCGTTGGVKQLGVIDLPDGSKFAAIQATNKTEGTGGPEGSTVYAFKCNKGQECKMTDVRFASDENANMKLVRNAANIGSSFAFGALGQLLRKPDTSYSQTTVGGGSVGDVISDNTNTNKNKATGGAGGQGGTGGAGGQGGNGTGYGGQGGTGTGYGGEGGNSDSHNQNRSGGWHPQKHQNEHNNHNGWGNGHNSNHNGGGYDNHGGYSGGSIDQ